MSDHAWWTPARRKLYGRPTVNGMTCQICGRRCQEAERERDEAVAAEAQDLAGASLCLTQETRTNRESRAKRLAEAERRAVATEQGAA